MNGCVDKDRLLQSLHARIKWFRARSGIWEKQGNELMQRENYGAVIVLEELKEEIEAGEFDREESQ